MSSDMLTIGKLAERSGTSAVTIRYYEKQKLIPSSLRSAGGHRLYPETVIPILRFIQNAKLVGFTLEEINELLALQLYKKTPSQQIKNRTLNKLKEVQEKIAALQKIALILERLTKSCDGKIPLESCPILEALYNEI